jgi:dolichol-phosphate hexosyltransferase
MLLIVTPIHRDKQNLMPIFLTIPTLNEERTIEDLIINSKKVLPNENILIYDGNSVDKTKSIAKVQKVMFKVQNSKGKGNAMIEAIDYFLHNTNLSYICFIDGDLTYQIEEIDCLFETLINTNSDMVIGNRINGSRENGSITKLNVIGNYLFSILIKILYGGSLMDTQSGFRLLSRDSINKIYKELNSSGFSIETELCILYLKNKFKISSCDIKYKRRLEGSHTKLNPIKAGSEILKTILRLKFT